MGKGRQSRPGASLTTGVLTEDTDRGEGVAADSKVAVLYGADSGANTDKTSHVTPRKMKEFP